MHDVHTIQSSQCAHYFEMLFIVLLLLSDSSVSTESENICMVSYIYIMC